YSAKKRSRKKPLSVIFGSLDIAKKYVLLDKTGLALVKHFMPGPLTLVVKPKKNLAGSPKDEIAFRIPSDSFARSLAKRFGKPITATSANMSGKKPIYSFPQALKFFDDKVGMIIDAGSLPKRKVSTIFDIKNMIVVRKGAIRENKIRKFITRKTQ
ncbi:MAG: L-threonylcarbamoyladenylate synthase, partial [Candidatus Aenigmatarchaeota archaeon]